MYKCDHNTPAAPSLPPHRSPTCSECSGHSSYHGIQATKAPSDVAIKKYDKCFLWAFEKKNEKQRGSFLPLKFQLLG